MSVFTTASPSTNRRSRFCSAASESGRNTVSAATSGLFDRHHIPDRGGGGRRGAPPLPRDQSSSRGDRRHQCRRWSAAGAAFRKPKYGDGGVADRHHRLRREGKIKVATGRGGDPESRTRCGRGSYPATGPLSSGWTKFVATRSMSHKMGLLSAVAAAAAAGAGSGSQSTRTSASTNAMHLLARDSITFSGSLGPPVHPPSPTPARPLHPDWRPPTPPRSGRADCRSARSFDDSSEKSKKRAQAPFTRLTAVAAVGRRRTARPRRP